MSELIEKKCKPCQKGIPALDSNRVTELLREIPGWGYHDGSIEKTFTFKDYYQTIAFVNAVAWIANREDHHPDLQVGFSKCHVRYSTHAINGLSENDFICAAKINALFEG